MRVLITGANGQLGGALRKTLAECGMEFIALGSAICDITDLQEIQKAVAEFKPDWIVNTAAYTQVAKAESDSEKAGMVNVAGPENLAKVCNDHHVKLMHFSTDYVFSGGSSEPYAETVQTDPLSVYGSTKAKGEEAIRAHCKNHVIIRVSWLYDDCSTNFVSTMKRLIAEKKEIQVVTDQVASPTSALVLSADLCRILNTQTKEPFPFGTYHYSHEGECSWYEFACEIKEQLKSDVRIIPVTSDVFNDGVKRPPYSKLDSRKIQKQFNLRKIDWKEALGMTLLKK